MLKHKDNICKHFCPGCKVASIKISNIPKKQVLLKDESNYHIKVTI